MNLELRIRNKELWCARRSLIEEEVETQETETSKRNPAGKQSRLVKAGNKPEASLA
jgi:hypothetical protein